MSELVYDSSRAPKDNIEKMREFFKITERKGRYEFRCLKCSMGWALPTTNRHPGNYLHLLNHAYSHRP